MANVELTLERASMSMAAKLNILTAEGCRRLRNCSLEIPWNNQVEYLNRLMISMMWGGYTQKVREVVARRILAKHTNNIRNFSEQSRPLYRSMEERNEISRPDKSKCNSHNHCALQGSIRTSKIVFIGGNLLSICLCCRVVFSASKRDVQLTGSMALGIFSSSL